MKTFSDKRIPRFALIGAGLIGLGLTAMALSQPEPAAGAWPAAPAPTTWNAAAAPATMQGAVAQPAPGAMSPPGAVNARAVAGIPGVPTILFGSNRPHPDRGTCTNCHTVVMGNGNPVPNIQSFAVMPHEFRGVCGNCHQVTVAGRAGGLF